MTDLHIFVNILSYNRISTLSKVEFDTLSKVEFEE